MKNKELNLCEVLKGHEGEKFYSPLYGDVELLDVAEDGSIHIKQLNGRFAAALTEHGKYADEGELMLYPSRKQRDWNVWVEQNKKVTYSDIVYALFEDYAHQLKEAPKFELLTTSERQLQKLFAINKLMNVQKCIEKGWQPEWNNISKRQYIIEYQPGRDAHLHITHSTLYQTMSVYFSSEANARRAIEILGEDTIKQALSTDW